MLPQANQVNVHYTHPGYENGCTRADAMFEAQRRYNSGVLPRSKRRKCVCRSRLGLHLHRNVLPGIEVKQLFAGGEEDGVGIESRRSRYSGAATVNAQRLAPWDDNRRDFDHNNIETLSFIFLLLRPLTRLFTRISFCATIQILVTAPRGVLFAKARNAYLHTSSMLPDEMNPSTASPASARLHPNNQQRRVLGDVSPNIKPAAPTGTSGGKMYAGSPLKRSFTAAMEGGQGFRYLKKRKLSIDSPLSQMMTAEEAAELQDIKVEQGHGQAHLVSLKDSQMLIAFSLWHMQGQHAHNTSTRSYAGKYARKLGQWRRKRR